MRVKVKVKATQLHIRKGPGTSYAALGHRKNGETFIVTKKKVLSNGEVWYKEENKTKWSCAKTKSGSVYIKVLQDLEKKSNSKKTNGKGKKNNKKGGTKGASSHNINPKKTGKTIKDVKAHTAVGIPKEKNKASRNPTRFSTSDGQSSGGDGSVIEYDDSGKATGMYYKEGFFMYTSLKFPKITTDTNDKDAIVRLPITYNGKDGRRSNGVIGAIDGTLYSGKYKGWFFHGIDNSMCILINPAKCSINYKIDPDKGNTDKMNEIRRNTNIPVGTPRNVLNKHTYLDFNRFKIQYPDELLKNAMGVVFFTRPDLNIIGDTSSNGNAATFGIKNQVKRDVRDYYILLQNPPIGASLTQRGANVPALKCHNFNILLSNQAQSIDIIDDNINLLEYGKTFTGYKMHYAKSNTESMAAGTISVKFKETYDLAITNMHQIWVDYQSNVYKGIFKPKSDHIWAKELDYACNIYYFLLDADMETILFWTKYYGCFPSNVPKSTFSYDFGSNVQFPDVSVTYNYIYKSDLSPQALVEFNQDGGAGKLAFYYAPIGTKIKGKDEDGNTAYYYDTSAYSWVGVPYIATYRDMDNENLLQKMPNISLRKSDKLKLRYRKLDTH